MSSETKPLPRTADEMTGEQALQILRWLEQNVDYLEHGGRNPNGDADGRFWPHRECMGCAWALTSHARSRFDITSVPLLLGCTANCERFADKSLAEYVLMRIGEEGEK